MESGIAEAARINKIDPENLAEFTSELDKADQKRLLLAMHMGDPSAMQWLVQKYRAGIKG